eukprot:8680839-Alexandrium_andersonii.AAC.1
MTACCLGAHRHAFVRLGRFGPASLLRRRASHDSSSGEPRASNENIRSRKRTGAAPRTSAPWGKWARVD